MKDLKNFKIIIKYLKKEKAKVILYIFLSIILNIVPLTTSIF